MASIEYVVNATDHASAVFAKIALSADGLDKQLEDLGKRVADPEVNLQDAKFTAGIIRAAERLDKLNAKIADPKVEIDAAAAQREILRINAMLDRLDAKRVNVTVDVDRRGGIFGRIGGLFSGAGAGAGSGAGGLLSLLGAGGASPYLLGAGALLAASLAPALLPLGLGALAGGGAAGGALLLGGSADKQLLALQKALQSAKGKQRENIRDQIAALQQSQGGELGVFGAFQGLGKTVLSVFSGALTSRETGFSGAPAGQSFLQSLAGILKQIAAFTKSMGPQLGNLFRASVPYLQMFVKLLEQAGKVLLPVFTNMLKQMQPFLPLIFKGLMNIVGGLAGFLKAIGPSGMQASAKIFVVITKGMAAVLVALGHTINWLAEHVPTWAHNIAAWWDRLRHDTAASFDAMKNAVLAWWNFWVRTWHMIVNAASSAWDILVKGVKSGLSTIVYLFTGLPGRAIHALWGLGHSLAAFMRAAWNEMWAAAKNVGGSILHWVTSWASNLWHGLLHFFHIGSPSGLFYDIGKNLMLGLRNGIQDHIKHAAGAAQRAAGAVASYGARTGSVAVEQRYAAGLLSSYGWPGGEMGPLISLWNRESGWNPYAVNPSSGAYGIPQSLGHGHPYNLGDYKAQIIWGLNYIASRYGSPGAAWAHEISMGWYDRGGWLPPGLSMALNTTGRPERVGGGDTINVYVTVGHGTNPRQAAQEIIKILNQGATAGMKLRSSILGPG